jgi:regulator of sigma E protease
MIIPILVVFFSLITLIILHELGHFFVAKKFGVEVEEFGIFLPPRLFGKKIGETVYSINVIPFGAFVRVKGEEGKAGDIHDMRSFSTKPIWQRFLIVAGGVVAFWVVAAVLLSIVMGFGVPVVISDEDDGNLLNARVQITAIALDSPAQEAKLQVGDIIREFKIQSSLRTPPSSRPEPAQDQTRYSKFKIHKVREVQEFVEQYKGQGVILTIQRGKDVFEVSLVPRVSPPAGEGPMGVALARIAEKSYPWYQAPFKGIEATLKITGAIVKGLAIILGNLVTGKGLPEGVQLMGPVGIGATMTQFVQLGVNQYLHFIAVISIYMAIFNILPIPALDGGKLLFLGIEKIKGRPVNPKLEQKITAFFFTLLLFLIILVTIRDITRLL